MNSYRVSQYAETQARVFARIGVMPDTAQWRHVADTRDLDTLVGRMRDNGLGYWVEDLSRTPDTTGIEEHLRWRLVDFCLELGQLLPNRWRSARRWLETAGNLVFIQQLLDAEQPVLPDNLDSTLLEIAGLPKAQRNAALKVSGYCEYMDQPVRWRIWWKRLPNPYPGLSQVERHKLDRIRLMVTQHLERVGNAPAETARDLDIQWHWRNELALEMRPLLSGDPFHVGLIFVYGVLKALQFERCRALLICISRGWGTPDIFRGIR